MTTRELIDDFLGQKRVALVGVSRNPKDFSRTLYRELQQRGYEVVPVNPQATELEGQPCFARLQDINPPVDGALLMTSPEVTDQIVHDCAEAGISRVWLHRGEGIGAVSQSAVDFCQAHHIKVVPGFCPFMFLPQTAFFHRAHGFVMKISGRYPH
jgi:predicted CoA-binding protein